MDPVHCDHRDEHDQRVENVQIYLVRHDVTAVALDVLRDPHHRADEDEQADDVQADHVPLPRHLVALRRRRPAEPRVEDGGCDDEEAEEDDLQKKAADDDAPSGFGRVGIATGEQAGARGLHEEGEDVAADEDLGQPGAADEEGLIGIAHAHDAAELHVN